jgi:hypothetical protein
LFKIASNPRVISVHGSKKGARNIEQSFAPGHRHINCLQDEKVESCISIAKNENEGSSASQPIELECETKQVPLDPRVPDKIVMISQDVTSNEETELLLFLDKNNDVFVWRTSDLTGVSRLQTTQDCSTRGCSLLGMSLLLRAKATSSNPASWDFEFVTPTHIAKEALPCFVGS